MDKQAVDQQKNNLIAVAALVLAHLLVSAFMLYNNMKYRDLQLYSWALSFVVCLVVLVLVIYQLNQLNAFKF
jgi:hypothetical protein